MRTNRFMGMQFLLLSLPLFVLVQCRPAAEVLPPEVLPLPDTTAIPVTDNLHGVEIVDPYRWLEDQESPETRAWIDAQNAYTDGVLDPLPGGEALTRRITELMKVDEIRTPGERSGRFF